MIIASEKGFQNLPRWHAVDMRSRSVVLDDDLVYISGEGKRYVVPSGFRTDFASVPQLFQNIIPTDGDAKFPGILHDYAYHCKGQPPFSLTRLQSDNLLLEALQLVGAPLLERRTIWPVVRLSGWIYWSQK